MSTEQSVDPQLVEETKQQIRGLVSEIANLAKADVSPEAFYGDFLDRVVSALAAIGGAVWTLNNAGQFELAHQINLRDTRLAESKEDQQRHGLLMKKIVEGGEGTLVQPRSGSGEQGEAGNPTDFLLVMGPIKVENKVEGLVEVFQRPNARPATQRGYLRFLMQMCDLAADFLKSHQLRHFTNRQAMWGQLEQFTRVAHQSLDPNLAAFTLANEGRRLIECDRVSVAIRRGRKCYIEAVSGQDTFDKRANTITLLNRLATVVTNMGEPIWYTGDTSNMAPQIEDAMQEYVDESHSKTVAVLPLIPERPESTEDAESAEDRLPPMEPVGALIVEQIEDSRPREGMLQRVEVVREHGSLSLGNALEHNSLFLMPVWRTIGKSKWLIRGRTLPKTVSVLAAIAVLLLVLCFYPANFELEGEGTLQPALRQDVFTQVDGRVMDVKVRQGETVAAGDVLAELESPELDIQLEDLNGQLAEALESLGAKQSILLTAHELPREQRLQLQGEVRQLKGEMASLKRQIELIQQKKAELIVRAPVGGQVLTWDVERELMGRPVQRGQVMLTIGDPTQEWELEVKMPEKYMGHIVRYESEQRQEGDDPTLLVDYVLMTEPGRVLTGKVTEIHRIAEVQGEEGNAVIMRVAIDKQDIYEQDRRPGAEAKAHVHCGRASLGYVYFHELLEWGQRMWFTWF